MFSFSSLNFIGKTISAISSISSQHCSLLPNRASRQRFPVSQRFQTALPNIYFHKRSNIGCASQLRFPTNIDPRSASQERFPSHPGPIALPTSAPPASFPTALPKRSPNASESPTVFSSALHNSAPFGAFPQRSPSAPRSARASYSACKRVEFMQRFTWRVRLT
jgi:hypothetical protein